MRRLCPALAIAAKRTNGKWLRKMPAAARLKCEAKLHLRDRFQTVQFAPFALLRALPLEP